jgi:hypothetical protein
MRFKLYDMNPAWRIVSEWRDDLIWCPSQCCLNMILDDRHFVLYLRWRHSDPWTCMLIEVEPDGRFDDYNNDIEWYPIDMTKFTQHDNLDAIKNTAIIKAIKFYFENG